MLCTNLVAMHWSSADKRSLFCTLLFVCFMGLLWRLRRCGARAVLCESRMRVVFPAVSAHALAVASCRGDHASGGLGVAVVDREGHYKRFLAVYWMCD
jgi:hypothetical protein